MHGPLFHDKVNTWLTLQGVLTAMRAQLTSVDYWRSNDRGAAASTFLQVLAIIIPKQPLLHPQVCLQLTTLPVKHSLVFERDTSIGTGYLSNPSSFLVSAYVPGIRYTVFLNHMLFKA